MLSFGKRKSAGMSRAFELGTGKSERVEPRQATGGAPQS
jgi:hypothetical protein